MREIKTKGEDDAREKGVEQSGAQRIRLKFFRHVHERFKGVSVIDAFPTAHDESIISTHRSAFLATGELTEIPV
jgi:hypothetical protein